METKKCTKCGEEKPIAEFHKKTKSKDGYYSQCKLCVKKYNDSTKEYRALNYLLNREERLIRRRIYWKESEQRRLVNKKADAARRSAWKKMNRDRVNTSTAKRYASKRNATPVWCDPLDLVDFYTISLAFKLYTGSEYHVDHIVPLNSDVVCGLHCEANLQILPASENISKGNRHWPDMWQ